MGSFANADAPNTAVGRGGGGDYQVSKKDGQADKAAFSESMSKEYARTDKAGYGSAEVRSEAYGEYREVGSEGFENKPAKTILINQQSPRDEIHDDMLELDRELFDLEQGGGFSKEQLDEAKSKLDDLKSQMDDLPDGPMIEPAIYTGTPSKFGLEARMNQLEERIDRLEDAAKGEEVPATAI